MLAAHISHTKITGCKCQRRILPWVANGAPGTTAMKLNLTADERALIDRDDAEIQRVLSVGKYFLVTRHGREFLACEYDRAAERHEGRLSRQCLDIAAALRATA